MESSHSTIQPHLKSVLTISEKVTVIFPGFPGVVGTLNTGIRL